MISIVFIINPIAGGRNKQRIVKFIDRIFHNGEYNYRKFYTSYPGHAYEIALKEMKLGADIIVAVGGDGTINEIGRAIMLSETRLAIIPVGSGNGFARHFGIPFSVKRAVNRIIRGKEIEIDIGFVNEKPFFCTSGIGFDAELGLAFDQLHTRGFFSYVASFFRVFMRYHSKEYLLHIENEKSEADAFFINIANISGFGYHFDVASGASASDGLLDLVIVRKFPKWIGFILVLYSFFGIIDKSSYVIHKKVKNVIIQTPDDEVIIHIDGDPKTVNNNKLIYSIKSKVLRVII